ncbi:putative multidrug resistance protein EmrY [Tsuneonella dongtanensis]|uniref:Putative multidrug resistance protein EmrY n=1 Tax=Tsuneonella dongtanensis TaxID=692370 RepID=A0A1B2AFS8_9SPHN|nr:DHA2 family efflux MFS transporter permease subunit [Tsuneonella dongtanensis]ANY20885.1 putative multidrug resistance protein EmrY [Tsuneonella dongtanensis]
MASAAAAPGSRAGSAPEIEDVAALPSPNQPALIVGAMTASLMYMLDSTVANVALPHMQASLGASPDTITWVLTSYILATSVAMPITGWLADRIGARRLFVIAVSGFILASMACGLAQNLEEMVSFRVLQGVFGAFIAPLSQSFMLDSSRPSRQPTVMAIWSAGIMIGPIMGPIVGGLLTESGNWRWVFYINVPVGALSIAMLLAGLPRRPLRERRFDLAGFAMIGFALASIQLLLDRGPQIDWFESAEAWIYAGVAISGLWMAVIRFATARQPLVPPSLFMDRNFAIAFVLMLVIGVVMFATMALLPPLLQRNLGYDVVDTGFVMAPRGIGVLISMQLSGLLLNRQVDPRYMVAAGFLISDLAMWQMMHWSLEVDQFHVVWTGFLQGLGLGLVFMPMNLTAFGTLPPQLRTDGSSMLNLARNVGSSIGISIVTVLWGASVQTVHEELGATVTVSSVLDVDLSTADRYQGLGASALSAIDMEVNRQASMIGYANDFYLLFWLTLATLPLVFLMRKVVRPPARPGS